MSKIFKQIIVKDILRKNKLNSIRKNFTIENKEKNIKNFTWKDSKEKRNQKNSWTVKRY